MDIAQFVKAVQLIRPMPEHGIHAPTVLIRGRHGIGKSAVVRQTAKSLGLKLIDRRLSQMTEGDIIGLAKVDSDVTRFLPVDFILEACKQPVLLFFDEMNRATREVLQCVFQIVLDHEINGHHLHPETRIFVAVNDGAEYQVSKMDPALKDRFWIVDLTPTKRDWLNWAKKTRADGGGGLHQYIVDFFLDDANEQFLETATEPNPKEIYPSRRSWERLNNALFELMEKGLKDAADKNLFHQVAMGFVGAGPASAFRDFVEKQGEQITAEDILNDFDKCQKKLAAMSQEKWNVCVEKLVQWGKSNAMTPKQAENIGKFIAILPGELRLSLWMRLSTEGGVDAPNTVTNVRTMHQYARKHFLDAIQGQASTAGALP